MALRLLTFLVLQLLVGLVVAENAVSTPKEKCDISDKSVKLSTVFFLSFNLSSPI